MTRRPSRLSRRGFVVQIDTTTAPSANARVETILRGVLDELAAGRTSGGVRVGGRLIASWRFVRQPRDE